MSYTLRAMFPALLLSMNLTHIMPAMAADPAPTTPASPAEASTERPPLLSREQEEAQALTRQLPRQDLQQLSTGDSTFLALWKPANSDDPQGAIIIIPGADESPDWPDVVGPLRRKFPDAGWATLSLALPDVHDPALQAREADAPAAEAGKEASKDPQPEATAQENHASEQQAANKALAQADAEQMYARIESAIAFARQNKARDIVLLGHGSGGYWAARFINERASAQVQKLVLVAAREPANAEPSLPEIIPTLKVRTADFIYKNQASRASEERLQVSKRHKGRGYTQVGLVNMAGTSEAEQEQVFRRVRGWVQAE